MKIKNLFGILVLSFILLGCNMTTGNVVRDVQDEVQSERDVVLMETSKGNIEIELYNDLAPITVENFLEYVSAGFYDSTVFHRVIDGFMVQGGGFTQDGRQKETNPPIKNEANNMVKNERGTIAMARTPDVNSATAQFFINHVDNDFLDHKDTSQQGYGYAVFGRVISGIDVVDEIAKVDTSFKYGMADWPVEEVVILKVSKK